jgi:hypothetical protein
MRNFRVLIIDVSFSDTKYSHKRNSQSRIAGDLSVHYYSHAFLLRIGKPQNSLGQAKDMAKERMLSGPLFSNHFIADRKSSMNLESSLTNVAGYVIRFRQGKDIFFPIWPRLYRGPIRPPNRRVQKIRRPGRYEIISDLMFSR